MYQFFYYAVDIMAEKEKQYVDADTSLLPYEKVFCKLSIDAKKEFFRNFLNSGRN